MPLQPERRGATEPAPAPAAPSPVPPHRHGAAWLRALAVATIGLMLALSTGLLLVQREATLERARAQALREVKRLAAELEQSLRLAQASIAEAHAAPGAGANDLLGHHRHQVQTLNLPFALRLLGPAATDHTSLPEAQWVPGLAQPVDGQWVLPLRWRQPAADGGHVYEVTLPREALLARFASEGLPAGGSMSLFRLETDGATTVLVRHPLVASEQGRTLRGHVADAVRQDTVGVFEATSQIDHVPRIVGFQRLAYGGDRLVVVYALSVQSVLAEWTAIIPVAVVLTLLVAAAMAYGAWRLDRAMRALARSEMRFRLAAAHGQVWEWDFGRGFVQPSDEFFVALGHPQPPLDQMGKRFLDLIHPDDLPRLRQVLHRFFKGESDYRLEFRARDAQGQYRWFDTRGSGLRDASGQVTYMAGTTFEITDRKALEEVQRQTLKHLDTVANASAALAWTVDAQQHPDWLNQPWLDFTGRDLATECDTFWLDDVHPQDRERCAQVFNGAFEAREPYSMEYRLRRHDGEYRWLHEQGKPRYDADHRFIGYVGSCLDVTELRRAEAIALERGAILEQVFDVIKDMLFVLDAEERFVFFQAGTEDRLYRRPEDFLGRPMGEVMPPALVAPLRAAMQRAREGGIQEMDYSLDLPVGTHFFNARLAWLPGGEQCMFLVRDTSEQQAVQQARTRLNDFVLLLFRLASRFINLPVQQMDAAIDAALGDMGNFVGADRAYLFSYDHQAGTATNTHEWCAPGIGTQKALWQAFTVSLQDDWYQNHLRGEKVLVPDRDNLPNNALRRLLTEMEIQGLLTLPLMNGDACLGYVGLDSVNQPRAYGHEEITLLELFAQMLVNLRLRAQAAAQVREMTEQLEHKVEERTQQLHESVERLQTVNRELESFTYSASHDLRTPLRGIEGFSELLLEEHAEQLDGQGREYLQRIRRATLHMSQLVNDLLAYSHLQQLTEQSEPVTLAVCVQAVATPFRDELEARQGQLGVAIPGELRVLANPKGLAIVLRNLIDNALKFTPAGDAPRVRIEAQAEGDRVRLSVSDQGIGFDMRYHDRIFGMFQRLHRQDQIPGTGIGLALVQKAVERMGGQIRAESAPGQGATFHIELPRA
jgi:PAS domain S-box-containing protein